MRFTFPLLIASLLPAHAASAASPLHYSVSWVGNTFSGAKQWVQQDIRAMQVAPDGTVYTNIGWDEGGREVGTYKDGQVTGAAGHTHGWGYNGGSAIAVNGKYLFIAQSVGNEGGGLKDVTTWPPKDFKWLGVSRRLRTDITQPAPFEGGKGGSGDTLKAAFIMVDAVAEKSSLGITGLGADENHLYIGDPEHNQVAVYDANTMQPLTSWPCAHPGPLVLDGAGGVWMLQDRQVSHFRGDGTAVPTDLVLPTGAVPSAICLDTRGRLMIADDGPAQQILIFDHLSATPRLAARLGQRGGIYAPPEGAIGELRFNHPAAIGCDAAGSIYVAQDGQSGGGGNVLESYHLAPTGARLNWRLLGLEFVDMADLDPADENAMFTKEERFQLDGRRPAGQDWNYRGYTIQRFKYPQDPRLHVWSAGAWVRRIAGRRFLFVHDMNNEYLQVYRFEGSSEIAIPSGLFARRHATADAGWPPQQPAKGEWIWRDINGNGAFDAGEYSGRAGADAPEVQGWSVDAAGNVWQALGAEGVREFKLQGLDAHGNPIWNYAAVQTFAKPPELDAVKRLRYDPAHDVMYLGGITAKDKNQHWKPMGPVLARYDKWSEGNRKPRWNIVAPYEVGAHGHESCEPMGFDIAGDLLFVPYTGASKEMGFTSGHIELFSAIDGLSLGKMEPGPLIGDIGLQDIPECLSAHRTANGDYLVFLEEDWKSKILLYRLHPPPLKPAGL